MTRTSSRVAYAFYATDDNYAVSAMVAIWQLKKLGVPAGVDFVLLHLNISDEILEKFRGLGVRLVPSTTPTYLSEGSYQHSLVKLEVLTLTDYETVLFMDADGLAMQTMSELFDLEVESGIAAPICWWFGGDATTCLMLVKPSAALYSRVSKHFPTADAKGHFDMDIINTEFMRRKQEILLLEPVYGCLDAVWGKIDGDTVFGDQDACVADVKYVHFTEIGKPWTHPPGGSQRARPEAHPFFHELHRLWWARLCEVADAVGLSRMPGP